MGDIGELFPPSDAQWKDADSAELLKTVHQKVSADGWRIENIDCVIHLEKPKFLPYRTQVRESIAAILGISINQIFVKAKTGEKLGDIGNGNAITAQAVCLLSR